VGPKPQLRYAGRIPQENVTGGTEFFGVVLAKILRH
jgi:hypothetical protein